MNLLALLGGGLPKLILQAYQARLTAKNDADRLEADLVIEKLESARALALAESSDPFSATRLGRWLLVVPFGLWWASIFIDSIFNTPWVILAIPPAIMEIAKILIPAIVLADAGALVMKARK